MMKTNVKQKNESKKHTRWEYAFEFIAGIKKEIGTLLYINGWWTEKEDLNNRKYFKRSC